MFSTVMQPNSVGPLRCALIRYEALSQSRSYFTFHGKTPSLRVSINKIFDFRDHLQQLTVVRARIPIVHAAAGAPAAAAVVGDVDLHTQTGTLLFGDSIGHLK